MKIQKLVALALGMALLVQVAACGQTPAKVAGAFPGTADADTVVLDIAAEPMELNPMLVYDAVSTDILSHCLSGLTKLDENDRPVADLAEKWEISPDNRTYTMYLRKDAKWSNGAAVTAADYYFSWVTQLKPETGAYMAAFLYNNIKNAEAFYLGEKQESDLGIRVVDDYTLSIEWERPMSDGLFLLALPTYFPVNQKAYEEIGAENYGKEADKLLTNGAYGLSTWVHDDHLLLEKSVDYYGAANIQIPKVKLVMIGDDNTRLNAFMTGAIDLGNLYGEQIAQVKEKEETAIQTYFDGGSWYLGFNQANPILANKDMRMALSYAVDIQSLLDNIIADGSVAAAGLVPNTIAGVGEESYAKARGDLFAYDVEKAKKHLDLALEALSLTAQEITLSFDVANTPYSQRQAEYIQQEWKKNLDITVELNAQAWSAVQDAKWNGDFDISIEVNSASQNNAMSFLEIFTNKNEPNMMQYVNPAYEALVASADMEGDPQKKQDLMIAAEKMLIDDMVIGPMYFTCTTYAVSNKLKGLVRTPFQTFNVYQGATISK